jgi:tight adherence protein C
MDVAVVFGQPALVAAVAAAVAVAAVTGYARLRSDPLDSLDVSELALVNPTGRRRARARSNPVTALGRWLAPALAGVLGTSQLAKLARRLELAGNPGGETLDLHLQRRARYLSIFGTAGLVLMVRGQPVAGAVVVLAAWALPELALRQAARARQERIDTDLPDFLDVLAVTVTAGLSFRAALERVARRHRGPLADELVTALRQLDVGESRREAFTRLRDRNSSEALHSFVSSLLQAEELGAPLSEALTQIARDLRRAAAQRARRRAARTSPRVTLVVTLVMAPGAMILIAVSLLLSADVDLGSLTRG